MINSLGSLWRAKCKTEIEYLYGRRARGGEGRIDPPMAQTSVQPCHHYCSPDDVLFLFGDTVEVQLYICKLQIQ